MALERLKKYLDEEKAHYVCIQHSPAFTAAEVAESAHVSGHELAKVVVVQLDGRMALALAPAPAKINLNLLREVAGAGEARLAAEAQFKPLFPECETGAMPPFGPLFGMPVYASHLLVHNMFIAFNACSHTVVMRMAYVDFARLARPIVAHITE
jgi:Ala-tRNA(Pro) deacylase